MSIRSAEMTKWQDILRYSSKPRARSTVRRFYDIWRKENGLPLQCDNPQCHFHTAPLAWNGKPLGLILDHVEGNKYDNHPSSLRYLCPNCDSQLETRGGANRGRLSNVTDDGYILKKKNGTTIAAATGRASGSSKAVAKMEVAVRDSVTSSAQQSAAGDALPRTPER
jgi:hypothetical protein